MIQILGQCTCLFFYLQYCFSQNGFTLLIFSRFVTKYMTNCYPILFHCEDFTIKYICTCQYAVVNYFFRIKHYLTLKKLAIRNYIATGTLFDETETENWVNISSISSLQSSQQLSVLICLSCLLKDYKILL